MRNTIYANYQGIEYSAGIKEDGNIVLRSGDVNDIQKGFFEKKISDNSIYLKYVSPRDIDEIYDKRVFAKYKGYRFEVIDEKENEISILIMTGDYREWLKLGMTQIDKGVYQKWISKDEAEINVEKKSLKEEL